MFLLKEVLLRGVKNKNKKTHTQAKYQFTPNCAESRIYLFIMGQHYGAFIVEIHACEAASLSAT